jgi:glucose-1-phosphate cytidylyltransferase
MKAVILAGGFGTRLSEETVVKPKPMVEIGDKPILWHIMKIFSAFGINDFIVCLGYKGYVIKEFFNNYLLHTADVTIDVRTNRMEIHEVQAEPWRVTLVETGTETMSGGRLGRVMRYVGDETFCLTYGDGLADVDLNALIAFHRTRGRIATVTAVRMPGRFGALAIAEDAVTRFEEKPVGEAGWINGGFFVLSPQVARYIKGDDTVWEREPLEELARENQLSAYLHHGFWQPMDTLRDKIQLERLWQSGHAPWKRWP